MKSWTNKPPATDSADFPDWLDQFNWKLSGIVADYGRARRVLRYLSQTGDLSAAASDHELAYNYAMASSDKDEDVVRKQFDSILQSVASGGIDEQAKRD